MSSYTAKLFRGVLPVSVLFLSVCLLIYFLLPSEETESVLDSYAELANAKYSEELALEVGFKPEYLELVSEVKSEEYYVNMMIAWYMATALAKQWNESIVYIEQHRLSQWVHKKTIQKAIESYRITDEQKEYLRSLK